MNVDVGTESGLLRVSAAGEFVLADAQSTFLQLLEDVARHHAIKVLFDGRQIDGNPETIERFYYGEFVANCVTEAVVKGTLRFIPQFAYVLKEPVLDPARLGETVALNRGMWVKAFDNLEDAMLWLQPESDPRFRPPPQAGDT